MKRELLPEYTMKYYIDGTGRRRKGVALNLFDDIIPYPNQRGPIVQAVGYVGTRPTHIVLNKIKKSFPDWILENATPLTDRLWTYLPSRLVLNSQELLSRYNDYLRKA